MKTFLLNRNKNIFQYLMWFAAVFSLSNINCYAATFSSGSTGADGALEVLDGDVNLDMTSHPDGVYNFTSINIATGNTLTFTKNIANTPVYLLSSGPVVIEGNIDVSGKDGQASGLGGRGGPGGFDGGSMGTAGLAGSEPSPGYGPGGGAIANSGSGSTGGSGSYGTKGRDGHGSAGPIYGSQLLIPLVGGSGGGGSDYRSGNKSGGGGGGAILIASDVSITLNGKIFSLGGDTAFTNFSTESGTGSGGAIRLIAPIVEGAGELDVSVRGEGLSSTVGRGRVRVDSLTRTNPKFNLICTGSVFNGDTCSIGSLLQVLIPDIPTMQIIRVGQDYNNPVAGDNIYIFPAGSPATQEVEVQYSNFTADTNIRLQLTPESGVPVIVDDVLQKNTAESNTQIFNIDFPANISVKVNVWTR